MLLFQFAYANLADSTLVQQILEQAFSDIRSHEIVGKAKQAFVEVYGGNRSSSSIANDDLVCSSYSIPTSVDSILAEPDEKPKNGCYNLGYNRQLLLSRS